MTAGRKWSRLHSRKRGKVIEFMYYNIVKILTPCLDVRGSVHHSTIHKGKSNKMQEGIKILLLHIYMKLNMFRATHRPSSGA
jgi:hypothetical protein